MHEVKTPLTSGTRDPAVSNLADSQPRLNMVTNLYFLFAFFHVFNCTYLISKRDTVL